MCEGHFGKPEPLIFKEPFSKSFPRRYNNYHDALCTNLIRGKISEETEKIANYSEHRERGGVNT